MSIEIQADDGDCSREDTALDSNANDGFHLRLRTLTQKIIFVPVKSTTTLREVSRLIEEHEGIPPSQQRLIYQGRLIFCEEWEDEDDN
ncbi:Putative Ubiquitin-like domain-containing protein [Septoria linicola]|uniref:Ubiquitin-like domain-containing protein n=1 Tax=Septoria linicola TaxID=215465 RepID=A0A9Q9B5E3_9PEZI|nr:putative Ubiquitin-like domain-containing protein [Septoria linicola]USW57687.1 Putative Ubiquitin-like domain-containing protein [Septoria linicola]